MERASKFWTLRQRLDFRIKQTSPDSCWPFRGSLDSHGYGQMGWQGKLHLTHRLVWENLNGPIPNGLCVCHTCDNRKCCNPKHLFLGTKQDNYNDMTAKGREHKRTIRGRKRPL